MLAMLQVMDLICWLEKPGGKIDTVGVTQLRSTCIGLKMVTVSAGISRDAEYLWMSDVRAPALPATSRVVRFNVGIHSLWMKFYPVHGVFPNTSSIKVSHRCFESAFDT